VRRDDARTLYGSMVSRRERADTGDFLSDPLVWFGELAECRKQPYVATGGFIVPGPESALNSKPGKEKTRNGLEQAASREAGQGQGQTAASGASPSALEPGLGKLALDVLEEYYPLARVTSSTSTAHVLDIPVGLFRQLPFRARLTLEIPLKWFPTKVLSPVPGVRAWARWDGNADAGLWIRSHHLYPDLAICACEPRDWIRGIHPLHYYVSFCVMWIAKTLHEREIGFWPGPQDYGPRTRVTRDRPNEYCGCTSNYRYGQCHRDRDFSMTAYERWRVQWLGGAEYMADLRLQGRAESLQKLLMQAT
jgi:hypothetical protein